jgi:predicted transcriptional regulator
MKELTELQTKTLHLIIRSWVKRGKCPTNQEVADRLGLVRSAVALHVRSLVAKGYLSDSSRRIVKRDTRGNDVRMECRLVPKYQGVLSIGERGAV